MNETQPAPRFADFLQTNPELMNEIPARLRGLQFAMVRKRRGSASQQLIGDMSACARSWQCIHQPDDPSRVFQ